MVMRTGLLVFCLLTIVACAPEAPPPPAPVSVQSPEVAQRSRRPSDFGDLNNFNACSAKPRRDLSSVESCWIRELSAECGQHDDCMVSCLTSPDGMKVGGGCWHLCGVGARPVEWWDGCQQNPSAPARAPSRDG